MSRLRVSLESIQHVVNLTLDLDLSANKLMCLVGRNGTGKTTLVRALRNLSSADTFIRTATPYAFSGKSRITYDVDGISVAFIYDEKIRSLNCREPIPASFRNLISAELPMPHGSRFNYFKNASEADLNIRSAIGLNNYAHPEELVAFLNAIYGSTRYSSMAEVRVKGKNYYVIVRDDGTYIREDYLSSGEYFLINLYRTIKGSAKLLVIDEIDISLDAAAQANLAAWLRSFCAQYECKILFTTHSLALMQQLEDDELFYMDEDKGQVSINPISYSHAKARLFGFAGWDRYILTEDKVLFDLIHHLIDRYCPHTLLRYKVIYIGAASRVGSMMRENEDEQFLASPDQVIAVLDGDQKGYTYARRPGVHTIPIDSVEKALFFEKENDPNFLFPSSQKTFAKDKHFYEHLLREGIASQEQIFDYLIGRNEEAFREFAGVLTGFLLPPSAVA